LSALKQRHPVPDPKIAACLITKNSEASLEAALETIRPFVHEINIYDTGSKDGTFDLLERLSKDVLLVVKDGTPIETLQEEPATRRADCSYAQLAPIRVKHGTWRNDFSWARTQSFKMASPECDWFLWLDDDDLIVNALTLQQLAYTAPPELDGFVMRYDYAHDEAGNLVCVLWRERLMRRASGFAWKGAIHEVLIPPDGRSPNFQMVSPEMVRYIHERPPDRYPPERNLRILQADARKARDRGEQPDPRTLAYLGTEHMALGKFEQAIPFLHEYLGHPNAGWSDERMQVQHKLATCLRLMNEPTAAYEVEHTATKERFDWAENYCGLVETCAMLERWPEVEHWAQMALKFGMPQSMLILNPLEFSLLPLARLSEACAKQGRFDEADHHLAEAAKVAPGHPAIASQGAAIAQMRLEGESLQAVLKLREMLVRHDENLKALQVIESAPYYIADHPAIVQARSDQREMCRHYLRPEEYVRWYEDEPKESTYPWDEIDEVPARFERVKGLLDGLAQQEEQLGRKPRVLDLGCNDWALVGASLWRHGFVCDGVELNKGSYERALELVAAETVKTNGHMEHKPVIVQGDLHEAKTLLGFFTDGESSGRRLYDAVSIFEVLEHVPDVEKALEVAESMLRPGGRVYLSTPNGAFERGNLSTWARVERKGHLRALPVHELAELIIKRGRIEDVRLHAVDPADPRLTFLSYTPRKSKGKVVFYGGGAWEPWSPRSMTEGGLGGSETALAQVSIRMAMDGYEVKVYSGAEPGMYGGALWRPLHAFDPGEECDLLVVSRVPHIFDRPVAAKRTAFWSHDHSYPEMLTEERLGKIDHVVVLSEWQKARFARLYPAAKDKLTLIRNGIGMFDPDTGEDRYAEARAKTFTQRKPRAVFSSSADRGLDVLVGLWPKIRERVPDAELHIFYGFNVLDAVARQNPQLQDFKRALLAQIQATGGEEAGIFLRGRVGQRELADEMGKARVWAYPTAFLETSCIGAMEARAAGLPIVTSDLGALHETVGDHGYLIPWGNDEDEPRNQTKEYIEEFVDYVAELLTRESTWHWQYDRLVIGCEENDWQRRIPDWEALVPKQKPPKPATIFVPPPPTSTSANVKVIYK
jgi:glycosyltransferase involved in cell wall biosynthesis/cyclopropane fatty-acyl-phospholipid synthase-like methyltransferase